VFSRAQPPNSTTACAEACCLVLQFSFGSRVLTVYGAVSEFGDPRFGGRYRRTEKCTVLCRPRVNPVGATYAQVGVSFASRCDLRPCFNCRSRQPWHGCSRYEPRFSAASAPPVSSNHVGAQHFCVVLLIGRYSRCRYDSMSSRSSDRATCSPLSVSSRNAEYIHLSGSS
jgi:hypothetical protein